MIEIIFIIAGFLFGIFLASKYYQWKFRTMLERWRMEFEEKLKAEILERSRAVLKGKIGEQLAPLLPAFKHEPADARFIGSPVDYIVFEGYKEGEPQKIIFLDVKTGKSRELTPIERKIKKLIDEKKIEWETVEIPEV
ncbi:MAG: Holliday junction resolvase-like protein [Candidatus Hadarchaeales archaeon]